MGQPERIVTLTPPTSTVGGASMDRKIERPKTPLKRWGIIAAVVAGAAASVYFLLDGQGGRVVRVAPDRVTISTVAQGTFEDFIPVRGRIAPLSTVYLETIEGGRVEKVLVEDGATVKAGDPILELSNTTLQLDVISREAQIAEQLNNLQTTELLFEQNRLQYDRDLVQIDYDVTRLKRDLDRKKALVARGAISRATFDAVSDEYNFTVERRKVTIAARDAEQKLRMAQTKQLSDTVERLQSNLGIARRNLDALTVRAPIDGQLTALDAEIGQSKDRGAKLGQIDSIDAFKITAEVDEFYVARVDVGQSATLTLGGQTVTATVAKVYPQIRDGRFTVDLKLEGKTPAGIRRGQAVDLRLELGGATPALLVANGPFYQDTGGNWAFVLDGAGAATRRDIKLGRRNPQVIEVLSGLQAGDRILTSSYQAWLQMDRIEFEGGTPN
ncbi:Multidrug resistance protein MdtA [Alphaproteobacteria bacterium SO-S41]|nr:Multidrug resistance protein MdtA [Alphaproteobacteria bacterium SO-S41]